MTDWIKYLTLRLTLWINGYEGGVLVAVQSPQEGWLDVEMVVAGASNGPPPYMRSARLGRRCGEGRANDRRCCLFP